MSEPVESSVTQLSARAIAQKAYKKGKKKRAKASKAAKQAEKKKMEQQQLEDKNKRTEEKLQPLALPQKWCRITWSHPKATDRPVDDDRINELLEKRSASKAEKNYTVSDEITRTLVDMEIFYDDENKQWHTRMLLTDMQKQAKKARLNKRTGSISNDDATTKEPPTKKLKIEKKKRPRLVDDQ